MKILSVAETDKSILDSINTIYLDEQGFDLDPTFSKGIFYKDFPEPKEKSDLKPQREDVKQMDSRELKYPRDLFKSIMFDPPFLFRNRKAINNDKICGRFSYFQNFQSLCKMYEESLREFYRVLKVKGFLVFKCQDMTDGKFYDTHTFVINKAKEIGFNIKDIFILVKKNKITPDAKKQNCARKVHSYYLVFIKESKQEIKNGEGK